MKIYKIAQIDYDDDMVIEFTINDAGELTGVVKYPDGTSHCLSQVDSAIVMEFIKTPVEGYEPAEKMFEWLESGKTEDYWKELEQKKKKEMALTEVAPKQEDASEWDIAPTEQTVKGPKDLQRQKERL